MTRFGYVLSVVAILLAFVGCGSGSGSSRMLQSMDINPPSGSGQVQFVATGHYNQAPLTVTGIPVTWALQSANGVTLATITQNGVAQCEAGASGTTTVSGSAPANTGVEIVGVPGAPQTITGQAVLNCP